MILCILKGILPFKMHKIMFFSRKPKARSRFHQYLGRVGLPLTQVFFCLALVAIHKLNVKLKFSRGCLGKRKTMP